MPGWRRAEALPDVSWPHDRLLVRGTAAGGPTPPSPVTLDTPACSLSRGCGGQVTRFRHAAMLQMDPGGSIVFWHRTSDAKLDPHRFLPPWAAQAQYLTLPLSPAHAMQVHGGACAWEVSAVLQFWGLGSVLRLACCCLLGCPRPSSCQVLSCIFSAGAAPGAWVGGALGPRLMAQYWGRHCRLCSVQAYAAGEVAGVGRRSACVWLGEGTCCCIISP